MKIKSIKIENLFEIFNYDIKYPTDENVLILTGPNGFGKTKVLNIIFNLFNKKFLFFQKLVFDKIIIFLENDISIEIEKNNSAFIFKEGNKKIGTLNYNLKGNKNLLRNIESYLPIARIGEEEWVDRRTDRILSIEELITEYADHLPDKLSKPIKIVESDRINEILDSINVHLIREQRLFKKVSITENSYHDEKDQTVMIEAIKTYASELEKLIDSKSLESYRIYQTLDSSYTDRLISEKNQLSKDEFNKRLEKLKIRQDKLAKHGIYESNQKIMYSKDDAKALLVYLNDLEKKLGIFDDLLEKLELFTSILNERRFTFKSIIIDQEKGFYLKTSNDKELELNQLSSGEQHEVVLLYELIFNTKPNIFVLIDEPEISLHVTWQKEFLNDLLRIIKIQKFQVLIATHSPSIINDRWDLVYNLEKTDH